METLTDRQSRDIDSHRLSDVRRELIGVNEKIESISDKVDLLNQELRPVPERMDLAEEDITMKARKMAELEERNKLHSAKLKLLQNEVRYEKLKSEMLKDYLKAKGEYLPGYQYGDTVGYGGSYNDTLRNFENDHQQTGAADPYNDHTRQNGRSPNPPQSPRRGDYQTSPVPGNSYPNTQAQTKADIPVAPRQQRSPGPASPRKDSLEQRRVDEDPKKGQYSIPDTQRSKGPGQMDSEDMLWRRRKEIYSIYDSTAINPQLYEEKTKHRKYPWFDHETHPYPGGFLFMRFDDSGYDSVNVAIKSQQSICRNAGGYLMGIARKQKIFVYELGEPNKQQNWVLSRNQPYSDARMTENSIAAFWFTKKDAAENFFENCHRNRFREPCFPTPRGYEAFYVPLLTTPPMRPYNTFLFIEILLTPAKRDALQENMTQFEAEMRTDLSRVIPGCQPMVVSSTTGRVIFKPGLFISPYSKLFISRFESQKDVDQIWRMGMIQALRQKWGLTGEVNVYSMTIDDAF